MSETNAATAASPARGFEAALYSGGFQRNRILVVQQEAPLSKFLKRELEFKGFQVALCRDGEQAIQELRTSEYDLVIQDLDLPGLGGMHLLHALSDDFTHLPVVVLTARSGTEDRVQAWDRGVHDYIVKPFSLVELEARVRSVLRRTSLPPFLATPPAPRRKLSLNKQDRRVTRGNRRIDLTPREFALLEHLVEHEGQAVSRATLMEEVWNTPFDPSTNIIDVYMKYLRDKIDGDGEPKLIRTIRGVGYMLDPSVVAWSS